ncbi:hypothetical protein IAI18_21075 [Acetobacteraceae bacterium H6797]|nr:hypothetical protein [Acetobacteraceae bacterium H6797]
MIEDLIARLAIPGLPSWTGLVALLLLGLVIIAFLLMPFSVFGVKSRLEAIEAQLDDIQAEIRGLALRMTDAPRRAVVTDEWVAPPSVAPVSREPVLRAAPPVPPPATVPERQRSEPRLDWNRDRPNR